MSIPPKQQLIPALSKQGNNFFCVFFSDSIAKQNGNYYVIKNNVQLSKKVLDYLKQASYSTMLYFVLIVTFTIH